MTADTRPIKVFYSYSHKDRKLRSRLETSLSTLRQEGVIEEWHDGCIDAGQAWEPLIYQQLAAADLVLLLISPDFIQSQFCYRNEMEQALKRHEAGQACVIPIILQPTDWEKSPFSKLQCLPEGGKPVTAWRSRNDAFLNIARGIRKVIEGWRPKPYCTTPSRTDSHTLFNESSYLREVICFNQGQYVQYQFVAGELHKALRIAPRDATILRQHCDKLEDFLERNLGVVAHCNFKYIINYFHGRHPIAPRVCIKINSMKNKRPYISPLFRSNEVNYLSEYLINKNSGFKRVKKDGAYFICNDIPSRTAYGGYDNGRIDRNLARVYCEERKKGKPTILYDKGFQFDKAWIKCWKIPKQENISSEVDLTSCYKSTLIIPITLWNNKLDSYFLDMINVKMKENISKTTFGYLCLDHVEENYFKDDIDVNVGYMFADILSLYMMARSTYTKYSETFLKARDFVSSNTL